MVIPAKQVGKKIYVKAKFDDFKDELSTLFSILKQTIRGIFRPLKNKTRKVPRKSDIQDYDVLPIYKQNHFTFPSTS